MDDSLSPETPSATGRAQPLTGLTVLDLGQIYQGPYCGFMLAMAGATVIKIEPPQGEPIRMRRQSALPLAMLNSNKLGVTIDLKSEEGRARFLELVERADVVIENFAPGVMDRLGVGAAALLAVNPRLVYASASGYGTTGPDRDRLAMDLTIQAMSGAMHVTGYADKPPVKAGPAISDFLGGTHLYGAIVTALYERERTGLGRVVEIAMQDAMYPALASNLQMYYENPNGQPRVGNRHGALAMAPYNTYVAKDGYVAIICVTDGHWRSLCQAMRRFDLLDDPAYATHDARCRIIDTTDALVEAWSSQLRREEIVAVGREHHFPCAPVRSLDEVVHDPQMHQRGMLQTVDHPILGEVVLPGSPLRFEGTPPMPLRVNPQLGEHNADILNILDAMREPGWRPR
jgi:CoA:oxalate CoA-transferase